MSNQLENKSRTLRQILLENGLTKAAAETPSEQAKTAGDQTITHTDPKSQNSLGREQTEEINAMPGVQASTPAASNDSKEELPEIPNCQSLNRAAEVALNRAGTKVEEMNQKGEPQALPKTAADYQYELACIIHGMNKKAALEKQAAEARENFISGNAVMEKFAAYSKNPTEDLRDDLNQALDKLAKYNPLFDVCRDNALMRKIAADVDALMADGMSQDDATAALEAAADENPELAAEAEADAGSEAVADLADLENQALELEPMINQMAANASENFGTEVTPDMILEAIDQVEQQAAEMGVDPVDLLMQAVDQLQAEAAEAEPTEDEMAEADSLLQEAAGNGTTPDEVLEAASAAADAPAEAPAEAPEDKPAEDGKKEETKTASVSSKLVDAVRSAKPSSLVAAARKNAKR